MLFSVLYVGLFLTHLNFPVSLQVMCERFKQGCDTIRSSRGRTGRQGQCDTTEARQGRDDGGPKPDGGRQRADLSDCKD